MEASRLYERRGRLFEESVSVLRRALHEDKVTVDGEFYRFTEVTLGAARPSVPPPIIVAGSVHHPQAPGLVSFAPVERRNSAPDGTSSDRTSG